MSKRRRFLSVVAVLLAFVMMGNPVSVAASGSEDDMKLASDWSDMFDALNGGDGHANDNTVDDWYATDQVSNVKLEKSEYYTGSQQTINISFDVANIPSPYCTQADDLHFAIVNSSFSGRFDEDDFDGPIISMYSIPIREVKVGTNALSMNVRFADKGAYYLVVAQDSYGYLYTVHSQIPITVKAPSGGGTGGDGGNGGSSGGTTVSTKASVRPQFSVYSAKQASTMKLFYSVDASDCEYHLYVRKGLSTNGYAKDQKYVIADFMTSEGNLPTQLGKELSVTLKKTEKDFDYKGVYTVVLYNMTTGKQVAKENFYVIYEKYVIQRDATKMKDDGTIPFYCDADLRNFNMDKDEKYSFQVCFPLNYKKYINELKNTYYYDGEDEDLEDDDALSDAIREFDESVYLSDNYKVYMTVSYTPEGSKESRKLFTKTITGMYKAHTVTLSSQEIMKKIYETNRNDIAYAGVVEVKFDNEETDNGDYQDIANDAIIRFKESFKFGVYKAAGLTKAEASPATTELAYGESEVIKVGETLGGKIYADIYKGDKKIDTVKDVCSIKSDGTATGEVLWNLKDSEGNWVDEGEYTAKVHSENVYTEFAEDGSTSDKKVKSEEKTVSFKVEKPNRSLTLSTSVSGISGGNAVYVENPVISAVIKANIGVSVIVSVKTSGGVELQNSSAICRKGQRAVGINLSGKGLKVGKYKISVTAETMDGQKKTATAGFYVKKLPKSSIKGASLGLKGGIGTVSFGISEFANVSVTVKAGSATKQTVISQAYSAGNIKATFSYGGYKPGTYKVIIKTKNSGGSSTVTKNFTIKKKPVVVKKPTVSNLSLRVLNSKDGDQVQGTFAYTGKGARVVIDIMYVDTEEIVYTYQGVTKNDSGVFTYTWDGYKSNGFRCWAGNYIYRVYLVNSAGATPYLRQNFTLAAG